MVVAVSPLTETAKSHTTSFLPSSSPPFFCLVLSVKKRSNGFSHSNPTLIPLLNGIDDGGERKQLSTTEASGSSIKKIFRVAITMKKKPEILAKRCVPTGTTN